MFQASLQQPTEQHEQLLRVPDADRTDHPLPNLSGYDKPYILVDSDEVETKSKDITLLTSPGFSLSRSHRFSGWRLGSLAAALVAFISLVINIAAVAWLASHSTFEFGLAELFRDECFKVGHVNTYVHLAINIVGTLLLGGSNYCMQCLVAPSRKAIDKAHQRGKWLDIGVPSWRNLWFISGGKRTLWLILVLSSLPIHLMYNSAFYASTATHSYVVRIFPRHTIENLDYANLDDSLSWAKNLSSWERLSNAECIRAYASDLVEDRSNVVVVTTNATADAELFHYVRTFGSEINFYTQSYSPFHWICNDPDIKEKYDLGKYNDSRVRDIQNECYNVVDALLVKPELWAPVGYLADYCLSEPATKSCGFHANLPIIIIVVVCNTVKVMIMLYVAFGLGQEPLIVVGDAIQSFLRSPDITTEKAGLVTKSQVRTWEKTQILTKLQSGIKNVPPHAQTDRKRRYPRRWSAAGGKLWSATIICSLLAIIAVLGLLIYASGDTLKGSASLQYYWKLGFGSVNGRTLISGAGWFSTTEDENGRMPRIYTSVLVANLPQLILSILYFNLNSLVTAMCLATEWAGYATVRKYLRVSTPVPHSGQRSNYFLSIPYRFGVPLLLCSAALHWLISQSLFLAVVSEYDQYGKLTSKTMIATCGYSPIAMIFTICLAGLLLLGVVVVGYRQLKANIPVVGSCSLAISAACHPPQHEEQVELKPIMWGLISGTNNAVGHCSFSSEPVDYLRDGELYE